MSLPSFIAEVCFVFCAFLLFLSHNLAFHFVGNIQGVFLTCLKTTLHQDSDITNAMVIHRLAKKDWQRLCWFMVSLSIVITLVCYWHCPNNFDYKDGGF